MAMKDISVSELKAHLSKYLRMASQGTRIVVHDRDDPVAEIVAPQTGASSWRERLAREGRLKLGTQDWDTLQITPLDHPVDIQGALDYVREDPSEVRRR
jgi:antitoxin (DNA-binding transcriptional repressor) of toxin-antitoxin stability system